TVERLMAVLGLGGVFPGRKGRKTLRQRIRARGGREKRLFGGERTDQLGEGGFILGDKWDGVVFWVFFIDVFGGCLGGGGGVFWLTEAGGV
ncbi:hypothetical protein AP220_28315, partial [Escherichia coli]